MELAPNVIENANHHVLWKVRKEFVEKGNGVVLALSC
jgi:hypothetical protein